MTLPNQIGIPTAPAGAVMAFAGSIPVGWLECDGATYNRVDYPELFAALGGTSSVWGLPSGSTFQVPLLDGRTVIGDGGAWGVGTSLGASTHTLTIAEMPSHDHTYVQSTPAGGAVAGRMSTVNTQGTTSSATSSAIGGGGAHNNMQPSVVMYYGICTGKVLTLQTQNERYQIVTSSTRPASPYEGLVIYETDTNLQLFHTGSGWRYTPGQTLAEATVTANQNAVASGTDFTGLSVTFDALGGPVSVQARLALQNTGSEGQIAFDLKDSGGVTIEAPFSHTNQASTGLAIHYAELSTTPTTGSKTYKLTHAGGSNVNLLGSSTRRNTLKVVSA